MTTNGSHGPALEAAAAANAARDAADQPEAEAWPVPPVEGPEAGMFSHMFEERFADLRRRSLTQINVLVERSANGPLLAHPLAVAVLFAAVYLGYLLPAAMTFGNTKWQAAVDAGSIVPRPGGNAADVHFATALLISFGYVALVIAGVRFMERRSPVDVFIFEFMAVYNCTQVLLNLYSVVAILFEVQKLGMRMWGYEPDASPAGYALGQLIWLQYHCRQLELMDTFFMVLRKKFHNISAVHMYLRVLNMWGWFFACRFACGGDTYFPALVTSATQVIQYLYFSVSVFYIDVPFLKKARITEVQIASFILCLVHNLFVAASGHMPRSLAILHLFVIINGLVLYTDFHHREEKEHANGEEEDDGQAPPKERVTFSFDSAGWLYVYQFGVAAWLQEHMTPGISPKNVETNNQFPRGLGFSGSSAGALTALLLASGTSVRDVFEHVLAQHAVCSRNPRMMPICVEDALRRFQFPGAFRVLTGRLRILVTRVLLRPPFFMGEVVDEFPNNEAAIQWLLASCHVPIVFGVLPFRIAGRAYYDGMAWSSLLVPWRGAVEDRIIKVSGIGSPLSDIRAPMIPLWWCFLPPSRRVLRGLFWRGYQDAALYFKNEPRPFLDFATCSGCSWRRQLSPVGGTDANKSRRASRGGSKDSSSGGNPDWERQKWKAASALLRMKPPMGDEQLVPAIDETTGEEVLTLINDFQAAASRRIHTATMVALGAATLVALTYLPPRNAALGVAILISSSVAWFAV